MTTLAVLCPTPGNSSSCSNVLGTLLLYFSTKVLDKSKPPKSIFETKQILSVVGQTIINFTSLYYVLNDCKRYTLPYDATMERDGDFEPNILSRET